MKFTIVGQIKSGKNNMGITRSGHRYPRKSWADWRDNVKAQILAQSPRGVPPIDTDATFDVVYIPGDKIRRDVPGMLDALFHCFERTGIVSDDTLFKDVSWKTAPLDRGNPRVEVTIFKRLE